MKSKAMVLTGFNTPLEMKEFDIPDLKPGQVLIRMKAAGVCGSDVHMWKGEDPRTPLPIILGHEGVGTVAGITGKRLYVNGAEVKEGDMILWDRGVTCGRCYACTILKEPYLCTNRKVYGINISCDAPPHLNGCYSEYIVLSENTNLFRIDEDIDPAVLVSASCSGATAAHAFDHAGELIGKTVVIQGPGPLGVYSVVFARSMGASKVIVIGGSAVRLELCRKFGATHVLDRHSTTIKERKQFILDITGGRGADLTVEAVGVKGAAEEGVRLLRTGGTFLSTGYAQPAGLEGIDFFSDIVRKNIHLHGIWVSDTSHTLKALNLCLSHKGLFKDMISHRFPLEKANEALIAMNKKEALKAVLTFKAGM